jgi:hypothetical protein
LRINTGAFAFRDSDRFGARVAQWKSDTRGEGLMRVQVSPRAPKELRISDFGFRIAELVSRTARSIQSAIRNRKGWEAHLEERWFEAPEEVSSTLTPTILECGARCLHAALAVTRDRETG